MKPFEYEESKILPIVSKRLTFGQTCFLYQTPLGLVFCETWEDGFRIDSRYLRLA